MTCNRPGCNNDVPPNPYRGVTPKFCSKRCKNVHGVNTLRNRRKQRAVEYLGGECVDCGYKKCNAAMHFHHLGDKEFMINKSMTMTWDRIVSELDKCVLLCANCHAERHYNQWVIEVAEA